MVGSLGTHPCTHAQAMISVGCTKGDYTAKAYLDMVGGLPLKANEGSSAEPICCVHATRLCI